MLGKIKEIPAFAGMTKKVVILANAGIYNAKRAVENPSFQG